MTTRIQNATVVTMNPQREVLNNTDIWIDDRIIIAVGDYDGEARKTIDGSNMVAIPGLIQPHIHLCQTLFRGLADDLSLLEWLTKRIWPLETALNAQAMRISSLSAVAELIRGGTTTILDMGSLRHTEIIFQTLLKTGIRGYAGKCLMDRPNRFLMENREEALAESYALAREWHNQDRGRIRYAPAPRFTLSASDKLFEGARVLADSFQTLVHTHAAETLDEISEGVKLHKRPPVAHLHDLNILGSATVLAHGVWMNPEEEAIVADTHTKLVHCPSSNLKLASGLAPTPRWEEQGVNFGIAADGASCNNLLDGFMEMRTAALMAKPFFGPAALPASHVFAHATIEGARVLGLEKEVGSLEVGKQADIVLLDFSGTHHQLWRWTPIYNQLVYQTRATDVHLTMVGGEVLYENHEFSTLDIDEINGLAPEVLAEVLRRIEENS